MRALAAKTAAALAPKMSGSKRPAGATSTDKEVLVALPHCIPANQPFAFLPEGEHEMLIVYKPALCKNQRQHAHWALRVQYGHFRRQKAANQLWYDAWSPLHWELYDDARICWPVAEEEFSEEEAYKRSTARWCTAVMQKRPAIRDRIYSYEGELYIPEGVSADAA